MPASPNAPNASGAPSLLTAYFLTARPKTWAAGLSPVCIGTVWASQQGPIRISVFFLTLLFSLLIQIGTNYANDYFDFVNGADTSLRKGPKRATQEGWISPRAMRNATVLIFTAALLFAIPLMKMAGLWSLGLAALCVLFGILYTGGPKPLGYVGLGELLVLIFYGPVAVCGTYFLQTFSLSASIFTVSLAPGFLSCAILIANNLRDEQSDRAVSKCTLVVRFGHRFGCWEYLLSLLLAFLIPFILIAFYHAPSVLALASFAFFPFLPQFKRLRSQDPLVLAPLLPLTALMLMLYTLIFCGALLW